MNKESESNTYRLVIAGVLAALAAVPVSVGVAISPGPAQTACLVLGGLLWLWAAALVVPTMRRTDPQDQD